MEETILGIDPGTREMGLAIIRGGTLLSHGVKTLRNGVRPHDVIGQARRHVLSLVAEFRPTVIAIEAPLAIASPRGAVLLVIAQELRHRTEELGLRVLELGPRAVRYAVVGNPLATKLQVAEALVREEFAELRSLVPQAPAVPALGFRPGEKYWLHMFDALALAVAARDQGSTLKT